MNKFFIFIFVVCMCKSLDAFCAKRCGEPWTRGTCETCACAAPTSCANCPTMSDCSCTKNMDSKCSCMDPECQCLKSKTRYPDIEYPMSILEMKPYFGGCCA